MKTTNQTYCPDLLTQGAFIESKSAGRRGGSFLIWNRMLDRHAQVTEEFSLPVHYILWVYDAKEKVTDCETVDDLYELLSLTVVQAMFVSRAWIQKVIGDGREEHCHVSYGNRPYFRIYATESIQNGGAGKVVKGLEVYQRKLRDFRFIRRIEDGGRTES